MRRFLIFFLLLMPVFAAAQTENPATEKRCKCRAHRDFLLEKSDTCFAAARAEADRFFNCRCWDEAMSLYRAAKSCADANQNARSDMNRRIEACRDSAEQELRRSELVARRQFLHAAAANLADDAQELLKNYDRSTAYRLADFAEQYIAPGPNAECLQALLDAWYYVPSGQPGSERIGFRVPFCYQLDYDMGSNVQARFAGNRLLYAFAPASSTLYAWDAESWEPKAPVQIEKGFPGFDLSPDDRTLLFFSDNTLLFWRSPKDTFRVEVPNMSRHCFSADGGEFFFFDIQQHRVYSLELRSADMAQRDYKNVQQRKVDRNEKRFEPRLVTNVNFEIFGMTFHDGQLWLAGRDSIAVLEASSGKERQWKPGKVVTWGEELPSDLTNVQISPAWHTAWVLSTDGLHYYRLPELADSQQIALKTTSVPDASLVAFKPSGSWYAYTRDEELGVASDSSVASFGCHLQPGEAFQSLSGAISPDNRWLAAATDTGTLKIWALHDWQNSIAASLPSEGRIVFSQNGDQLACYRDGLLQVFDTDQPSRPLFSEPVSGAEILIDAMGHDWVAWRSDANLLNLKNGQSGQKWELAVQSGMNAYLPAAFDENGRFVAYAAGPDSVVVRSLASGEVLSSQIFNGEVLLLRFVPGSGDLVVIQSVTSGLYDESQTLAKIWDPASSANRPRPLRLHGYKIGLSKVAPRGDQVAFSSGKDILVFHLDNLLDEYARIRPRSERIVRSLAFHPDGSALAAGYFDGTAVVWDLASGEARFHLKVADDDLVEELSFSADGKRLRLQMMSGQVFSRDISPDLIRAAAQNENRRLTAFTPEQIREHGLERALDYSGNFQRLAESGDLPLIRSFFEYYRQQALSSNNIDRVKTYFESAASLYSKLEDPAAQRALRPVMFEIYEDYNWKLLLRAKNAEAQRVLNDFNRLFGKPLTSIKISAHTALLRNDLPEAARHYADWTMRVYENIPDPYSTMDSLKRQFRQLVEYGLLAPEQRGCICGLYANILEISNLCPNGGNAGAVPLDAETRPHWNIFQKSRAAEGIANHPAKTLLLRSVLSDIEARYRKNPARWRDQLEKTVLTLAQTHTDQGIFEQENAYSATLYRQALQQLDAFGNFKNRERERLEAVALNRAKLANCLLSTDQIAEAARQCELGLETSNQLLRLLAGDTTAQSLHNETLRSNLFSQLGTARLLEGNAPAANAAFAQFYEVYPYWSDSLYFGLVPLLEGDENKALAQFGSISSEKDLGWALFAVSRLARQFPARRAQFEAFVPRLRKAVLDKHPGDILPEGADYTFSTLQADYFFNNKQIGAALEWQGKSLATIEKLARRQDAPDGWKKLLVNEMLLRSYYLLHQSAHVPEALPKAIAYAEEALAYLDKEKFAYEYRGYIEVNRAHAILLRNRPGDREAAITFYRAFVNNKDLEHDGWELLQKDFRDLHGTGTRWPDLKSVIEAIKPPDVELSAEEWREMGAI